MPAMADRGPDLRATLEQLHAELHAAEATGGALDQGSRRLLRDLLQDINELLERSGEPPPESTIARMREALDEFEGTHPALTEAVGRVVDALAQMGI
jgi:hypothetical protein